MHGDPHNLQMAMDNLGKNLCSDCAYMLRLGCNDVKMCYYYVTFDFYQYEEEYSNK